MAYRCVLASSVFFAGFLSCAASRPAAADDWPQWLGPQRDGVWRETGIIEQFPAAGLKVQWRTPVQWGYAGPAVANGRVFVMDYLKRSGEITNNAGARDRLEGAERVLALDAATGELLWRHEYDCPYFVSYPGGPRCTPTVDGDRVYTLGTEGNLYCLEAATGRVLWSKDFKKEYRAETPFWGHAAHPLVVGDLLVCIVGGEGSVAVAFDKMSGREVWRALSAREPGYCPPTLIEHGGVEQLLIWHPESINSLNPATGEVYWSVPLTPSYGMSIMQPRLWGDYLFASAMVNVAVLLRLNPERPAAEVVWRGEARKAVYCASSTPIIDRGVIYGVDCQSGALIAARLTDGERLWETLKPTRDERLPRHATAFLTPHRDRVFLFNETGDLILARLTPERYEELGRVNLLAPTNFTFGRDVVWSPPAFAGRSVFVRNDKELIRVSLAAEDDPSRE